MRKIFFFTLILLALSAWVVAQQEPSSQAPPSTSPGTSQSSAGQAPSSQSAPDATQGAAPSSAGQSSQTSPNAAQGAQSSADQNSVQGCLGGSGNDFTVTDKSGTSYQLQLPAGADASNLKPHIGEEVRVEGTTSGGAGSNSAASTSGSRPTITVKNIYRVSQTCSSKSGTAPKQ